MKRANDMARKDECNLISMPLNNWYSVEKKLKLNSPCQTQNAHSPHTRKVRVYNVESLCVPFAVKYSPILCCPFSSFSFLPTRFWDTKKRKEVTRRNRGKNLLCRVDLTRVFNVDKREKERSHDVFHHRRDRPFWLETRGKLVLHLTFPPTHFFLFR